MDLNLDLINPPDKEFHANQNFLVSLGFQHFAENRTLKPDEIIKHTNDIASISLAWELYELGWNFGKKVKETILR